jgi:hypothetical protein
MLRQKEDFHRTVLEESKKSYPEIAKGGFLEGAAKNESERESVESIRKFLNTHERYVVEGRANTVRVALHLYFLQHGRYPGKLDELLELVPESMLTDPFSTERFIYKTTDTEYLLYSVGSDMDDDGGRDIEPPYRVDSDGDFVFRNAAEPSSF